MSLFEIKPSSETKTVDYMGIEADINVDHHYVALVNLQVGDTYQTYIASFADVPAQNAQGYCLGTGDELVCAVAYVDDTAGSLRNIDGHTTHEAIIANTEEVAYKLLQVINDPNATAEQKVHTLYCARHGLFTEFYNAQQGWFAFAEHEQAQVAAEREQQAAPAFEPEVKGQAQGTDPQPKPRMTPEQLALAIALYQRVHGVGRA